jgi:penicillin-binding protein 1A
MLEVGPENVVQLAQQMGFTNELPAVNSLVLGTGEVSVLDMASAYSTFANRGTHIQPTVITRVERPDGSVVPFPQARTQPLQQGEADLVNYCLQQVVLGGTGTGAKVSGHRVAGKTGTTQDNRDAWFAGFAPNGFTTAVWMGYDVDAEGNPRYMDDVHGRAVTGGSFPATIWRKFMDAALSGVDSGSFEAPNSFPGEVLNEELEDTTTTSSTSSTSTSSTSSTSSSTTSSSTSSTSSTTTSSSSSTSSSTTATTTPTSSTILGQPP